MTAVAAVETEALTGAVHPDHNLSLNMLIIELRGGFDYTGSKFDTWARGAGFARTETRYLAGPTSAAIAYKE